MNYMEDWPQGVEWERERLNHFEGDGLMNREFARYAGREGHLGAIPCSGAWNCLKRLLAEFQNREEPRLDMICENLEGLVVGIYDDEEINLLASREVRRGEIDIRDWVQYDFDMLMQTGFFSGLLDVLVEVMGMNPISFGLERFTFEESRWQLKDTMYRWLTIYPDGEDAVLEADLDDEIENPFIETVKNIKQGRYDYNSNSKKVNQDDFENSDDERRLDSDKVERDLVRAQTSLFARHQLARLVDYLKRTKYGTDLYEMFCQDLTARYNQGTYPTVPIDDKKLEKYLIPKKYGNRERNV